MVLICVMVIAHVIVLVNVMLLTRFLVLACGMVLTFVTVSSCVRYALRKKLRDYLGIFPKWRTPPHWCLFCQYLFGIYSVKVISTEKWCLE